MSESLSVEQIRAARAMKGWGQAELAERAGLTQVTVANIESGKSRGSRDSMSAIVIALQNSGIEFIEDGVRLTPNSINMIEGRDSYIRLLDDVFFSLRDATINQEVLFFGSDERRSSPEVNKNLRRLREAGIKFRSLISHGNSHVLGRLDEYREMPPDLVSAEVVVIYSDKVGFLLEHKPHYRVLLVRNSYVSEDHRRMFEYFWKNGNRPSHSTAEESYD